MSSEARVTRSTMRTRASRGLAADFLELPATPSRSRATGKTPGKTPCKTPSNARLPFDELSNVKVIDGAGEVCQTPAVKDSNTLSDLERLLLSPTPRLTPETSAKGAAVEALAAHAAAPTSSKPQVAAAVTATETATAGAASKQAAVAEVSSSRATAGQLPGAAAEHAAEQEADAKAAAEEAAAAKQRLAASLQAAADVEAAAQAAQTAERMAAAKVAAEVQAAADAALMAAQLQAAEVQAAADQAVPLDNMPLDTDELAATPASPQAFGHAGSERWDVDEDEVTSHADDDAVMQQQLAEEPASHSVIKSRIIPTATFEPRSIRQLKKDIKAQYAKQAVGGLAEDGDNEAEEESAASEGGPSALLLADALGSLSIGTNAAAGPLRGVPAAQGKHLRFTDDGDAEVGSPVKLQLRGMPKAGGKHLRFD